MIDEFAFNSPTHTTSKTDTGHRFEVLCDPEGSATI